jgi:hypothetical protein
MTELLIKYKDFKTDEETVVEIERLNKIVLESLEKVKELEKYRKLLKAVNSTTHKKPPTNEFYLRYKDSYKKSYQKNREKILMKYQEKKIKNKIEDKPEDLPE